MKRAIVAVCALFVFSLNAYARRAEPVFLRDAVGVKSYSAAPHLAERAAMVPSVVLPSAESTVPEEIAAIREWNASGREPMRNGFRRTLPDVIDVKISSVVVGKAAVTNFGRGVMTATDRGTIVWSTLVKVEKAHRLRLHLENVSLPEGAVLWIYGAGEAPTGFGRELIDDRGNLWTPSTHGETAYLELEVPAANAAASFTVREVLELIEMKSFAVQPQDAPTCLVDSSCVGSSTFDVISTARRAIAHLEFVTSSGGAVCTGGLVSDFAGSGTPYMLTANHCFSSQAVASTVEAYFDFVSSSCNGAFNGATAPKTSGAQWLASSSTNDFTFIKMNSIPSNRALLGWDNRSSVITSGTTLHRLSHPVPADTVFPQMYSNTQVNTSVGTCTGYSRPNFIYSTGGQGGVYGGSSGSPVMLSGGYIVGQLLGSCGPDPSAGCDQRNSTVDGAFSMTYDSIKQFIDPSSPAQPSVCTQNATTLCLSDNRFAVTAQWQTADGNSGVGQATRLTSETGYFTFFSATNVEAIIKVLNGCGLNSRFWVFAGGLTNVRVDLTVRDTKTGTVKVYTNPLNTAFQPIQDTSAFATCP